MLPDNTEIPLDPQERARFYRQKASEYRALSEQAMLGSVRESYVTMAHANEVMAEAADRETRLQNGSSVPPHRQSPATLEATAKAIVRGAGRGVSFVDGRANPNRITVVRPAG